MDNFGNQLYSDSASLGYFKSLVSLIVAIVVGVVLIICSVSYFTSTVVYGTGKATITNANCVNSTVNNKQQTNCNLTITYVVDNMQYNTNLSTSNSIYMNGQVIDIQYDINNPTQVRMSGLSNSTIGLISLGIAIVLVGGTYFNYYLATNYKLYASAEGVNTVYNVFR
jgi:hypothetical protein